VATYVCDSSAVVKRYVRETGTVWVLSLTDPGAGHTLYVVGITGVEVVSALTRQTRRGALDSTAAATALAQFRHDWAHQYQTIGGCTVKCVTGYLQCGQSCRRMR